MGRNVRSRTFRSPLSKWAVAVIAGVLYLNCIPVAGSGPAAAVLHLPAASLTSHLRPAAGAVKPVLREAPFDSRALFGGHWLISAGGADQLPGGNAFADRALPFAEPDSPIGERLPAVARGGNKLASFPVGAGRFNLVWRHGTSLDAKLQFDNSPVRPTIELSNSGTRKIKLAVSLHW